MIKVLEIVMVNLGFTINFFEVLAKIVNLVKKVIYFLFVWKNGKKVKKIKKIL